MLFFSRARRAAIRSSSCRTLTHRALWSRELSCAIGSSNLRRNNETSGLCGIRPLQTQGEPGDERFCSVDRTFDVALMRKMPGDVYARHIRFKGLGIVHRRLPILSLLRLYTKTLEHRQVRIRAD